MRYTLFYIKLALLAIFFCYCSSRSGAVRSFSTFFWRNAEHFLLSSVLPDSQLLKVQFSTPVQRKPLWMESVGSHFNVTAPQLNLKTWQIQQVNPHKTVIKQRLTLTTSGCWAKAYPKVTSLSLTSGDFVSGHRHESKIKQEFGGMVRSLSMISLVSVLCAKHKNILL